MKHITDLNIERNQQIVTQAKEINELLVSNSITPIFLKGTGNLIEDLYEDIAERMAGDIDFIFSKEEYPKAIAVLTNFRYSKVHDTTNHLSSFKHHPRLQKVNNIAAVEIHKELLLEEFADEFNYIIIQKDSQKINDINIMSFENQMALSIIAKQINDHGLHYKNISLRNAYDVFLLSKIKNAISAFDKFNKLKNPLDCFLAICHEAFNKPTSLDYNSTPKTAAYIKTFNEELNDENLRAKHHKKIKRKLFIKKGLRIIYKSLFDKAHRNWLIKRTTDKNWYKEKLVQVGLKKPKSNS